MGVIRLSEVSTHISKRNALAEWVQRLSIPEFLLNRFNRMPIPARSYVREVVCRMRSQGVCHVDSSLIDQVDASVLADRPARTQFHMLLDMQMSSLVGRPRYRPFQKLYTLWSTTLIAVRNRLLVDKDPRSREHAVRLTEDVMDMSALILMHLMSQPTSIHSSRNQPDENLR
jgi:hypothetical protein